MIGTAVRDPITQSSAPPDVKTLDRILLAVDGSAASDAAVRAVGALVRGGDADVCVMHVSDHGTREAPSLRPETMPLWRTPASGAQARVDSAMRILASLGVRASGTVYTEVEDVGSRSLTAPAC